MGEKNLEQRVRLNSGGVLRTAAKYIAAGFLALGAAGCPTESECCQQLGCSGNEICSGSGDYSAYHICITDSEGHEECCGCTRESNQR